MQFSSIFNILSAAIAVQAAATPRDTVASRALKDVEATAEKNVLALEAQGCDVFGCLSAFAPTIGVCAVALAEPTFAGEIACFLAIVEKGGNPPATCNGCL